MLIKPRTPNQEYLLRNAPCIIMHSALREKSVCRKTTIVYG